MATVREDYLKPTVSGLWAHSHDSQTDLMKRYVIERHTGAAWLAIASFTENWEAELSYCVTLGRHRIWDQFANEDVSPNWED